MIWQKDPQKYGDKIESPGIYFLRTNMKVTDEVVVWNIYNSVREIESTFQTLKTDLDLRPLYHKTDRATMAHLHLGIMAYWLGQYDKVPIKRQQYTQLLAGNSAYRQYPVINTTGTND